MISRWWCYLVLAVLVGAAGLGYYSGCQRGVADKAQIQAQELKGLVDALKSEVKAHKTEADRLSAQAATQEEQVKALKAKLAALAYKPANVVKPADGGPADSGVPETDEAGALKDQIIEAQDRQISALKGENAELRAALDDSGKALDASERRARGLEIALEAQKHAAKSGRWLGRLEGFAIGVAVGFGGGKLVWR